MAIDNAKDRKSLVAVGNPMLPIGFDTGNGIDGEDRQTLGWGYSGIPVKADTFSVAFPVRRSRLDNLIGTRGKIYSLFIVNSKPDRVTGIYTTDDLVRVKLRRVKEGDNLDGKTRAFVTTFMMFGRRKPVKKMRFVRNNLEHEIMSVSDQGNNVFRIVSETKAVTT